MMRVLTAAMLLLVLAGCGGFFKMPKDEYRERVQVLGVLPLMVDAGSTITHPQGTQVVELLRRYNAGKTDRLIELLRDRKGYFDVRAVPGDPQQYFQQLVKGSVLRGQGADQYRRYQFSSLAAADLTQAQAVDALLVVIFNGMTRPEKRWDRTRLTFLETDYNAVQVTAAVVLPSGEIAWEFAEAPGGAFLHLQYPDFDEAHYNKTDMVQLKFVSLAGLERTLAEPRTDLLGNAVFAERYEDLFQAMAAALKPGWINPFKEWGTTQETAPQIKK